MSENWVQCMALAQLVLKGDQPSRITDSLTNELEFFLLQTQNWMFFQQEPAVQKDREKAKPTFIEM